MSLWTNKKNQLSLSPGDEVTVALSFDCKAEISVRDIFPDYPCIPFSHLPKKTLKVIENKRWQLDQIIK